MEPLDLGMARLMAAHPRPWALLPAVHRPVAAMVGAMPVDIEERFAARPEAASFRERLGVERVGTVDVIPVMGVITKRMTFLTWWLGGTALDYLREAIREALNDPEVSAIVLDIDSPGGSVDGMTEFAADLRAMRDGEKPIVAVADPTAASGALYIGMSAREFIVTPSGSVGSLGVYMLHWDISRELEEIGETPTFIFAGEYKVDGNPFEPLSDTARDDWQAEVNHFYALFTADGAKGRQTTISDVVENYGQGRMLLPQDALKVGMVDRIDTLENTIRRLSRGRASSTGRRAEGGKPDLVATDEGTEPQVTDAGLEPVVEEPVIAEPVAEPLPIPAYQPDPARIAALAGQFDRAAHGAPTSRWFERSPSR